MILYSLAVDFKGLKSAFRERYSEGQSYGVGGLRGSSYGIVVAWKIKDGKEEWEDIYKNEVKAKEALDEHTLDKQFVLRYNLRTDQENDVARTRVM